MGDQTTNTFTASFSSSILPLTNLSTLIERRQQMLNQIIAIKQKYHQKSLNPSEFYQQYEHLGLILFQINSDIQDLDPSQDDYLLEAIQL